MASNFEKLRGQRIGKSNKMRHIKAAAAAATGDGALSVVTQKESILGTAIKDISHLFSNNDDEQNPPGASGGVGGDAPSGGTVEGITEFVVSNPLLVATVAYLIISALSKSIRGHSDPLPA